MEQLYAMQIFLNNPGQYVTFLLALWQFRRKLFLACHNIYVLPRNLNTLLSYRVENVDVMNE